MRPGATPGAATSPRGAVAWHMPSDPGAGGSVAPRVASVTAMVVVSVTQRT
jgi:hypothetical protein